MSLKAIVAVFLFVCFIGVSFAQADNQYTPDSAQSESVMNGRLVVLADQHPNYIGYCTGIAFNSEIILTARHCYNSGYLSVEPAIGYRGWIPFGYIADWVPALSTGGGLSGWNVIQDGYDFMMLHASNMLNSQVNTFQTRAELLNSLKVGMNVDLWGGRSGDHIYSVVNISPTQNMMLLSGAILDGDSGGPVWLGDKLVGLVHGPATTGGAIIDLYYNDIFFPQHQSSR